VVGARHQASVIFLPFMKSVVHIGGWRSHQTGVPFLRCVKSVVHQWLETATKQEKHLSHL
jgi:hypothetical protein